MALVVRPPLAITPRSNVSKLPLIEPAGGTLDSHMTNGDSTYVSSTPAAGERLMLFETMRVYLRMSPSNIGLGVPESESTRSTVGALTEVLAVTVLLARFGSAGPVARAVTVLEMRLATAGT